MVLILLTQSDYRLAFIDMERIYEEYIDLKDAKEQVLRFKAQLDIKRDSLLAKIDSLEDRLEKRWPMLTDAEKVLIWREMEHYKRRLDSLSAEIMKQVEAKSKELLSPYLEKVKETAEKIAVNMGYTAVVDISLAVWVDPKHDITPLVLDELNKAYKGAELIQKRIAVFPLFEKNEQSRGYGDTIATYVEKVFADHVRFKTYPLSSLKPILTSRGITNRDINNDRVLPIAQSLALDVYVFGEVSVENNVITFTLTMYDAKSGKPITVNGNPLTQRLESVQIGPQLSNAVTTLAQALRNAYLESLPK